VTALAIADSSLWAAVAVLALAGLSILAYTVRALDLLGAAASFLLGLLIALLGGIGWMLLLVAFTGLGVVATRVGRRRKEAAHVADEPDGERGVRNVLGNGAAPALMVLAGLLPGTPRLATQLAFAAAVATVAADTLASELGVLAGHARSILPPFHRVPAGANGGVSLPGQVAALAGATAIAALAAPLAGVPWAWTWVPAVAGFAGCQVDSLLGATLEGDAARPGRLGKQDVNFLASLLPALVVFALLSWV